MALRLLRVQEDLRKQATEKRDLVSWILEEKVKRLFLTKVNHQAKLNELVDESLTRNEEPLSKLKVTLY